MVKIPLYQSVTIIAQQSSWCHCHYQKKNFLPSNCFTITCGMYRVNSFVVYLVLQLGNYPEQICTSDFFVYQIVSFFFFCGFFLSTFFFVFPDSVFIVTSVLSYCQFPNLANKISILDQAVYYWSASESRYNVIHSDQITANHNQQLLFSCSVNDKCSCSR